MAHENEDPVILQIKVKKEVHESVLRVPVPKYIYGCTGMTYEEALALELRENSEAEAGHRTDGPKVTPPPAP